MKKKHFHGGAIALNHDNLIVIRILDAKVLRILSRSLFLVMILVALPFLGNILNGFSFTLRSNSSIVSKTEKTIFESLNFDLLNLIIHDMADEGFYRKDNKALIVNSLNGFEFEGIENNDIDVVMDSDYVTKSLFLDESYDVVFMSNSSDAEFVDRIVKIGGIVVLSFGTKSSNVGFREQSHYRIVYLRHYGTSIIVALRKSSLGIKHQYGT